jgi:hypothetical protein
MSGGKGGTQTQETTIPEYINHYAQQNLHRAAQVGQLGYQPYYGPDVAALTPLQETAMENNASAANAFGLAVPTQNTLMDAPTVYANGVRGYSSQPIYQDAVDAYTAANPEQAAQYNALFGNTVEAYRPPAPAIQYAGPATSAGGGGEGADMSANDTKYQFNRPETTYSYLDRPSFTNDLNRSLTDPAYDPAGNVITRALNIGDGREGHGSPDDGTVLCTAYCNLGYLPDEIWTLDRRYGVKLTRSCPELLDGYRLWASPVARFIQRNGILSKALRAILWPIVRAWAEQMAHEMRPQKHAGNLFGKFIMAVGEPLSLAIGKTFIKRKAEAV